MTIPFQAPFFGQRDFYPYKINQSVRMNDDDSAIIYLASPADGNQKTWTFSCWVKRCNLGIYSAIVEAASGSYREVIWFDVNDKLNWQFMINASTQFLLTTEQVFRDIGSWYHLVFKLDTTQVASADHTTIYCNGTEITNWTTLTQVSAQNVDTDLFFESTFQTTFAKYTAAATYGDMYLSEVQIIEGLALTPDNFGQSKYGIWIPKRYTGSYGTNGFYQPYTDENDLGKDYSGNGNDFTSSGLTSDDQVEDSPTNNYCTLNVVNKGGSNLAVANGNLEATMAVAAWNTIPGTISFNTGKFYAEATVKDLVYSVLGVGKTSKDIIGLDTLFGDDVDSWGLLSNSSTKWEKYYNSTPVNLGGTPTVDDIMQIAVDADAGKVWFGVNNVWFGSGDPAGGTNESYSGLSGDLVIGVSVNAVATAIQANFGQLGFTYTPPTGYKALCSNNLPTPSVKNSSTGFDVVLWPGDGVDDRDIEGVGFDVSAGALVWTKNRTIANAHIIYDTVRGAGNTKEISSNNAIVEGGFDCEGHGYLSSFNNNGFTLKNGTVDGTYMNGAGNNYAAWIFRMGVKYGFDIIAYEGTGVAHAINHNLGGVPELIHVKNLENTTVNIMYHHHALNKTDPETDRGILTTNAVWADYVVAWNDTAPTATQFTVGTDNSVNQNLKDHIAYLWRSIEGFSKVFSYTGNGSADGPFVYCGFRPRFVLYKNANALQSWIIFDVKRDTYNLVNHWLAPDLSNAEGTTAGVEMDILSNGFKVRGTHVNINGSGNLLVGIAYAEASSKWSNSR